ncbi:hypothetical protein V5O48_006483 [Marasmius crinis-equi]|uniref:C2H2-type domain-containing protein n=1 Tax=Marasmius crinis-equi TaxID=585013 RepID=A0ABR3FJG4_9AGAR
MAQGVNEQDVDTNDQQSHDHSSSQDRFYGVDELTSGGEKMSEGFSHPYGAQQLHLPEGIVRAQRQEPVTHMYRRYSGPSPYSHAQQGFHPDPTPHQCGNASSSHGIFPPFGSAEQEIPASPRQGRGTYGQTHPTQSMYSTPHSHTSSVQDPPGPTGIVRQRIALPNVRESSNRRRGQNTRLLSCPVDSCNSTFTARHNLKYHVDAHRGIKDFQCEWCGRSFTGGSDCKRHAKKCRARSAEDED